MYLMAIIGVVTVLNVDVVGFWTSLMIIWLTYVCCSEFDTTFFLILLIAKNLILVDYLFNGYYS